MSPTTSTPDPLDDCRWTISGPLSKLPNEMLHSIFYFLPLRDLLALLRAFPMFAQTVTLKMIAHIEEDGISILHLLAATSDKTGGSDVAIWDKMLADGAVDANPICTRGNSPLAHAIFSKNEKATEALLKREDVDANQWFPLLKDQTPLIYAIEREEKRLIDLLIDREGVNVAQPNASGRTPLSYAAEKGDVALTNRLLPRYTDTDIGHADNFRWKAIHYAAAAGSKEVVELLLSQDGVEADQADGDGRTPLSYAAAGSKEVVELLLSQDGVKADQADGDGRTPLSYAAENGNKEVVEFLLSQDNVKADQADRDGRTPLSYAAENGNKEVVEFLLSQDNVKADQADGDGRTPLSYAAENGNKEVVELLLSQDNIKADQADGDGRTPLSYAAENGNKEVVELLLSQDNIKVDQADGDGRTPLSYAVGEQHEEVVRLLTKPDLYPGGKGDYFKKSVLLQAVGKGNEKIVELLLPRPNVDAKTRTSSNTLALFSAVKRGSAAMVKLLLLQPNVHADERDYMGRTPLSYAAERGVESVARLLLEEYSVRAHSRCRNNKTPLAYAAASRNVEIVNLLLDHVKEEDLEDKDSELLVLLARKSPRLLAPKLVHASRTDVNYAGKYGYTALFWASRFGSTPLVELLLSHPNINIDKTPEYHNTPLLEAIEQGHEDIALLLIKRGAHCERGPTRMHDRRDTPLTVAIRWERERVVEQILHLGVSMETEHPFDELPLVYVIGRKKPRIVKLLLDYYSKKTDEATSDLCVGLYYAVALLQPQDVQMLLGLLNGRVPKPEGCLLERLPMLSYLLRTRFNGVFGYTTSLHGVKGSSARERQHQLVVKAMLDISDNDLANMDKKSPFYIALRCQVFVAQMLLDRADGGPDWSRYHFQCSKSRGAFAEYEDIVRKLLARRDEQTAKLREYNLTPLLWAKADPELESYVQVVKHLLHAPEPAVNIVDRLGLTELLYALGVTSDEGFTWLDV